MQLFVRIVRGLQKPVSAMQRQVIFVVFSLLFSIHPLLVLAFPDVPQASPYAAAIDYVAGAGIMTGNSDRFRPDDTLSRAELLKILMSSKYPKEQLDECLQRFSGKGLSFAFFRDAPLDAWYAPHVCMAQKDGIIRGFSDGTFRPTEKVSFVEVAKIVGGVFNIRSDNGGKEWFRPFVFGLQEVGAIPTSIKTFDSPVTRAEIAEIMYRLDNQITDRTSKTFDELANAFTAPPCDACLMIDKLNIQVPIVFNIGDDIPAGAEWKKLEKAILNGLRYGVVHYPRTALPGQMGNVFITGHSSYYRNDPGKYKDVFAKLNELEVGDKYTIFYGNRKFSYRIFEEKIVLPQDVNVLDQPQDKELSSLMTCWPVNTNQKRRIFVAERVE